MTDTPLIRASQLQLKRQHKTVLDGVSLSLCPGQIITPDWPQRLRQIHADSRALGLERADFGTVERALPCASATCRKKSSA